MQREKLLAELLTKDTSEHSLDVSDIESHYANLRVEMLREVDNEILGYAVQAKYLIDYYFGEKKRLHEINGGKFGYIYPRIRYEKTRGNLTVIWVKHMLAKNAKANSHLRKGNKQFRYPDTAFKSALDWERRLINEVEDNFESIRLKVNGLVKIRASLRSQAELENK